MTTGTILDMGRGYCPKPTYGKTPSAPPPRHRPKPHPPATNHVAALVDAYFAHLTALQGLFQP